MGVFVDEYDGELTPFGFFYMMLGGILIAGFAACCCVMLLAPMIEKPAEPQAQEISQELPQD